MKQVKDMPGPFGAGEFGFWRANDLVRDMGPIHDDASGVYAFFLRDGERLLEASGYFALGGKPPASIDGHLHLYTGLTYGLGRRLKNHLTGETRTSTLRKSLLAIDRYCSKPDQIVIGCKDDFNEGPLSEWLEDNALIAVQFAHDPVPIEQTLLGATASPLNIAMRRESSYARRLIALRCALDSKPIPQCCATSIGEWLA